MQHANDAEKEVTDQLLDAILTHVPFDGWTAASFSAAISDTGMEPAVARAVCPRGAVDLALAYHARGDAMMVERLHAEDLSMLKFREKIMRAIQLRLEVIDDKEAVRRGAALVLLFGRWARGGCARFATFSPALRGWAGRPHGSGG